MARCPKCGGGRLFHKGLMLRPACEQCGLDYTFIDTGDGPAVFSLTFEAWPYQGRTGTVVVDIGAQRTEFPISAPAERTVDIAFVHDGSDHMDARVLFRQGLLDFVFRQASVGGGPFVVLDPTLAVART